MLFNKKVVQLGTQQLARF